ncbi:MAG: hypothetical protein A2004_05465 [Spirochaetes bacterium GWC1_61_12]|nr:MAG: hypothetical protein A2004_05465 [Spirochaetes bacterium GWC1_61_12]
MVQTVLTPHAGEYVRLLADCGLGPSDPAAALRQARYNPPDLLTALATRCNAIIVLKNSLTWLAHPDGRLLVYEGRVPALACGGSGDVLAGLLAGLTAAGYDAWSAAALAVLVHGETGRAMAARHGFIIPGQLLAPAARCLYHGVWHD